MTCNSLPKFKLQLTACIIISKLYNTCIQFVVFLYTVQYSKVEMPLYSTVYIYLFIMYCSCICTVQCFPFFFWTVLVNVFGFCVCAQCYMFCTMLHTYSTVQYQVLHCQCSCLCAFLCVVYTVRTWNVQLDEQVIWIVFFLFFKVIECDSSVITKFTTLLTLFVHMHSVQYYGRERPSFLYSTSQVYAGSTIEVPLPLHDITDSYVLYSSYYFMQYTHRLKAPKFSWSIPSYKMFTNCTCKFWHIILPTYI